MQFTKATKEQAKLRLALFGPSGSGKTFTALRLATGLTGKIAVIDTERGSASKYADQFDFDVLELGKGSRAIEHYAQAIKAAGDAGYDNLIIDSLSHAWFELLKEVEKIARAKYRGNTWSAWSEGTPKQRALVDAILDFDGHIIATMRVKTEWITEQTGRGKSRPVRVGLAPQQGKGIEYEFDLLGELTQDHVMTISKDRTGRFQDRIIDKPGEDMGQELAEWLKDGLPPRPKAQSKTEPKPKRKATKQPPKVQKPKAANGNGVERWYQFTERACKELGYNHSNHVVATLKKDTGEDGPFWGKQGEIIGDPARLWKVLVDHQEAKEKAIDEKAINDVLNPPEVEL